MNDKLLQSCRRYFVVGALRLTGCIVVSLPQDRKPGAALRRH
jgi:hypothetical protein